MGWENEPLKKRYFNFIGHFHSQKRMWVGKIGYNWIRPCVDNAFEPIAEKFSLKIIFFWLWKWPLKLKYLFFRGSFSQPTFKSKWVGEPDYASGAKNTTPVGAKIEKLSNEGIRRKHVVRSNGPKITLLERPKVFSEVSCHIWICLTPGPWRTECIRKNCRNFINGKVG